MKKILCPFVLCFFAISLHSQAEWTSKTFDVASSFSEIVATSGINLTVKEGTGNSLTYRCNNKDYLDRVNVENMKNRVTISMKNQGSKWYKNVKCEGTLIIAKDPTYIESSHGSNLSFIDLEVKNINIVASDGSNISGTLVGTEVNAESKSGSNLKLSGTATSIYCLSKGGSNLDTKKLEATDCKVYSNGGSNATIKATGKIIADAKNGSNVTIFGSKGNITKFADDSSNISSK
jgi:hypothetical protein